jgi:hypothetical protein
MYVPYLGSHPQTVPSGLYSKSSDSLERDGKKLFVLKLHFYAPSYTVLRIRDVYHGSRIMIFNHQPKTAKERVEKKFVVIPFL